MAFLTALQQHGGLGGWQGGGSGTYDVPGAQGGGPSGQPQQQSSVARGAYAPVQTQDQSAGPVSQIVAPTNPNAYMQAIQAQMAPAFQSSQQQLSAQEQAMGTLTSGAGNYANQQLTAQNNATLAGMEAPLIQQGFSQQYGANTTNANAQNSATQAALNRQQSNNQWNAGATNSYLTDLQNQYFTAGQNQINNNLQAQEYNATNQQNLQLANLGYANSNYQQQVGLDAGLVDKGLSGALNTTSSGQQAQNSNYMGTQQNTNPYLQSVGQASALPNSGSANVSIYGNTGSGGYNGDLQNGGSVQDQSGANNYGFGDGYASSGGSYSAGQ